MVAFTNESILLVANMGEAPIQLPAGVVVVASAEDAVAGQTLLPDNAVWIERH